MDTHTIVYVRWKALLFGGVLASIAVMMLWVGLQSLDPAWTATVTKGQSLVDAPAWVRAPVILGVALFCAVPGLWQIFAGYLRWPVVRFDEQGIEARTSFGRRRHLAWESVVEVKRKKNQLILSPPGVNTIGQEIWDRKSVILDIGMLDIKSQAIDDLITHNTCSNDSARATRSR